MKGEEKLSTQYNDAVKQIKTAILQSQAKALKGVNQEQLALYYGIGRFISQYSRAGFWGKDAIDTISRQLSTEVPGLRGFSPRNLRNMRMFYEEWKCLDTNLADASAKLDLGNKSADESANLDSCKSLAPLEIADIPFVAFFSIGFSHHTLILSKTKTLEERRYYIQLCSDLQLSYDALERIIAEDAYHNQGNMPNNFGMTIPDYKRAFQAIQMFKDEYLLDYINVEQLAAYLRVLDDEERIEGENPSVGIVLCKDADRAYVEYVLQDYTKPMGVATYKSSQERLRELLPDEEEIKKLL